MSPLYKLTYFATPGRAEAIRFLFSYAAVEFEDVRIAYEDWPALKNQTPFGFLPMLEHEGKKAHQSVAIMRYVAKQVKLAGNDDWEDLEIDATVDTLRDCSSKFHPLRLETDEEKKKALLEQLFKETVPYFMRRFEALVQKNNGYLALGRLTWADLYFVASIAAGVKQYTDIDIIKEYKTLAELRTKVLENPRIKKYLENQPKL
ncbi:glutathione S-transferase [Tribolium castaneum]|uniref:glutathione transferase n=1 Tax=Tribolium castaneum TaxID=7070 RepID=D6WE51_TRICA|nr:Glutathione S-transferase S1-like Protein [Tribolium castaneum]